MAQLHHHRGPSSPFSLSSTLFTNALPFLSLFLLPHCLEPQLTYSFTFPASANPPPFSSSSLLPPTSTAGMTGRYHLSAFRIQRSMARSDSLMLDIPPTTDI